MGTTDDGLVSRDVRMQRAAASLDSLDVSVVRELSEARARVELANEVREVAIANRNRLVLQMREDGVPVAHIALLLGVSYDTVVLIIREGKKAPS